MAITVTNKTSGGTSSSGTSATTASVTPTSNRLYLLSVDAYQTGASAQPPQPTITGNSQTWTLITSVDIDTTGTDRQTTFVFRALGASPSSGTILIDFGATTISRISWVLDEFDGIDTGGTNGSAAIVQTGTAAYASGDVSGSVTLAAFGDATNNVAYGVFGNQQASTATMTYTAGTGFTKVGENNTLAAPVATESKTGEDTTVDMSWTSTGTIFKSGGIAIEIKMAAAGGGTTVKQLAALGVG